MPASYLNGNWHGILSLAIKNTSYYNYFNYLKESLMRLNKCLFCVREDLTKTNTRILKLSEAWPQTVHNLQ